ncbi:MAG: glycoside hydrolase domain-containing protein [Thermogutta sp.]
MKAHQSRRWIVSCSPTCVAILSGFVWITLYGSLQAELTVWVETATRRLCREDLPPQRPARHIEVAAARNEWVGFQVFMRSSQPVPQIELVITAPTGPQDATITPSNFRVYREHQIHIVNGTHRNEAFRPGWYPDPLIPSRDPVKDVPLRGKYQAFPFDLPADETHGFYVDLFIPPGTPPGKYAGKVTVRGGGINQVDIPLTIEVWDFTLASTPALVTAFGSPSQRMRSYYAKRARSGKESPPENWEEVDRQCAALVSEHRMNAYPPSEWLALQRNDKGYQLPDESIAQLREWIDRYHVNAVQIPSPVGRVKDPAESPEDLRAWLAAWDKAITEIARPHVIFYIYLKDEPNDPEAYEFVRHWGKPIRAAQTKVKVLVVEQTLTQDPAWGDLYGAVDIWCSLFPLYDEATAKQRQALGEIMWAYTALCQGKRKSPWWHIDYPLLHYRVPSWISWRFGITGLLYWGGMSYWDQVEDPWTDANTYRPGPADRPLTFNGEGTLVYPARPCGYAGIVPSLRLKALRDSIEDYEYLEILRRAGKADLAQRLVLSLTPSWFEWSENPEDYEEARRKLAELILTLPPETRNATR